MACYYNDVGGKCNMIVMLNCIIAIIVISFCISVLIGCNIYRVLKAKFDDRVGRLEERFHLSEEHHLKFEEEFVKHMNRYH
jgi:hypothetical protein